MTANRRVINKILIEVDFVGLFGGLHLHAEHIMSGNYRVRINGITVAVHCMLVEQWFVNRQARKFVSEFSEYVELTEVPLSLLWDITYLGYPKAVAGRLGVRV